MPEGPIIVILKEAVQQFKGQKVIAASCNNNALDASKLTGLPIIDFKSWGKHFLICFPDFTVQIQLMMFGSYKINSHSNKPPRLHLQFQNGELNFYACVLHLINEPLDKVYDWSADVMSPKWDAKKAIKKIKEQPELLACDALMDQHIFSGVGNIIKNEVLFRTRVHPLSYINELQPKKLKELLNEAVNYSFDFLEWKKANTLKKHWLAYEQKICSRDDVAFHKTDTGKSHRSSFYCNVCQKLYKREEQIGK
ncbi:DNA-formamidopyrimidine glycosylase family protein [Mucilaginibacter sp.]|uniref:DNA-formamidopyrimidine glycosylase family protein n=1 Tax=Mucilaginibacter sp. TaxID=1882438 RepID=UPI003D0CC06A